MLKYFKTLKQAQKYADNNCGSLSLMIIIDREAKEYGDDCYCVVDQAGINHLDQMNWDYRVFEVWD